MDQSFVLMNIKNKTLLVKIFDGCTFDGETFKNIHGYELYGDPYIMANRGDNNDEFHVMMSWSPHNISTIASVEGHIDPETKDLIIYDEKLIPSIRGVNIVRV